MPPNPTPFPIGEQAIVEHSRDWDLTPGHIGTQAAGEVTTLARRFWILYHAYDGSWSDDLTTVWHHLLLAVANFKRQAGRIVGIPSLPVVPIGDHLRRDAVVVSPARLTIARDGDEFAQRRTFNRMRGFGVATGSALLAALWPSHHLIVDRLAFATALVLDDEGLARLLRYTDLESRRWLDPTWEDYIWYATRSRLWVQQHPSQELVSVERALYVIGGRCSRPDQRWREFRDAVAEHLS